MRHYVRTGGYGPGTRRLGMRRLGPGRKTAALTAAVSLWGTCILGAFGASPTGGRDPSARRENGRTGPQAETPGRTPDRASALHAIALHKRAKECGYDLAVLTRPSGHHLVVLGETHAKDPEAHRLGVDLLRHYPLRAFEHATPRYWAGSAATAVFKRMRGIANWFARGRVRDSTILDALSLTLKEHLAHGEEGVKSALRAIARGFHLAELSEKDRRSLRLEAPGQRKLGEHFDQFAEAVRALGLADKLGSMDDVWKAAQQLPEEARDEQRGPSAVEWLEWNHRPSTKEQVAVALLPLAPLRILAVGAPVLYPMVGLVFSAAAFSWPLFGLAALVSAVTVGAHVWGKRLPRDKWGTWASALFSQGKALVPRRDATMAQNLDALFDNHPDHEEAVGVVGADHLPGIIAGLEQKGWTCARRLLSDESTTKESGYWFAA